jgi:excisionase family DNA binding protein
VPDRLLTTREVADRLGVMPETVLRWIDSRGLPVIRLTSRALRYDEADLDAWLAERTTAAPGREARTVPTDAARATLPSSARTVPLRSAARDEEDP